MDRSSKTRAVIIVALISLVSQSLVVGQSISGLGGVMLQEDPVTKRDYAYLGSAYQRFQNGSATIEAQTTSNLIDNTTGRIDSTRQVSGINTHNAPQPMYSLTDNTININDFAQQSKEINNTILEVYNKLFMVMANKNNQSLPIIPTRIKNSEKDGDPIDVPKTSKVLSDRNDEEKPPSTPDTIAKGFARFK